VSAGTLEVLAAAKVNVAWQVLARREDGYHEVRGVLQTVCLYDRLVIRVLEDQPQDDGLDVRLEVTGDEATPPLSGPGNLVVRAAARLSEEVAPRPVSIRLEKNIPVGAGLGGGSADAAAALAGLALVWKARVSPRRLVQIAADVGSDVPALLVGGLVHCSGRGEIVRAIGCGTGTWFVLGLMDASLATADVYAAFDASRSREPGLWTNDLEEAAIGLQPAIAQGLRRMREAGALGAFVSGSGPTVVGLAANRDHAHEVARAVAGFRRALPVQSSAWGVRIGAAADG
jgi:4-diphosphocytidyl-2-C-methyl-D-erythritol kinase